MRILHVIPSLSPIHGGPSAVLPAMERALSTAGVEIETVTTNDNGNGQRIPKPLNTAISENGVIRWYFPKQTEFYKVSWPLLSWLRREITRFDVVHVHALFSFVSVAAARSARNAGVPYIIRPLGVLNSYGMTRRRAFLKRLSFRWIEAPLLRDASAVHFTSLVEQTEAQILGVPMRCVVIPLGIEPAAIVGPEDFLKHYSTLQGQTRLLFLSRIDPKKNLEGLLKAVAEIKLDFPQIALIVCGDGTREYIAHLQGFARKLGIEDRVVWTGQVEGELKAAAFAAADLFILPSFSENFGVAAAEALMAGLPCILGRGVAIADEVQAAGGGIAVAPDPAAIAEGIREMLRDDARRRSARECAQLLATENYSSAKMGKSLVALYRSITREPGK